MDRLDVNANEWWMDGYIENKATPLLGIWKKCFKQV